MTLQKLLTLLLAIPRDCRDLPVFLEHERDFYALTVIQVAPPDNGAGVAPCVVLGNTLDGARVAGALLIEDRRLPGTER